MFNSKERSFKLHVFLAVTLCVVAFVGASRMVVRLTSGEPFRIYFSEVMARHVQKELDASPETLDLKMVQANLEKSVLFIQPDDLLVYTDRIQPSAEAAAFKQSLASEKLEWEALQTKPFQTTSIQWRQQNWRVVRVSHASQQIFVGVNAAVFQQPLDDILEVRNQIALKMLPILIAFVVLTTVFVIYFVLKPIVNLQNAFGQIKLSSPHENLDTKGNYKEFAIFIRYFNELINRLRASYTQAARFSSDAAHELRTPLTIIRGHLHRLINQAPDGSTTQVELSVLSDEVERLISISNKLLFLSQADAGQIGLDKEDVNLNDLVGQMMDDIKSDRPDLVVTKEIEGVIQIKADRDLIFQLMTNLFNNALKYNVNQGAIGFRARVIHHQVHFAITNTTKLSLNDLDDRIFERFYRHLRVEGHEGGSISGSGLGLSLCKEIVKVHGGDLHLQITPDRKVSIEGRISVGT
jgi:signal transduction histidine kinase